ncbi:MAG: radical SAM/SPASM domain-containing protein [Armatimonadota bacterium]
MMSQDRGQHPLCTLLSPLAARGYARFKGLSAPDFPHSIFIETTSRCNLRCPICPRDQMQRADGDMDVALFETISDELAMHDRLGRLKVIGLHFFGDPLMHPEIIRMIEIIGSQVPNLRELGRYRDPMRGLGMSTNALLLTEDKVEPLLQSKLTSLGVAVDATSKTVYREMHGSERWDLLVSNVERLLKANARHPREFPTIGLQYIETPETRDQLAEFREMWREYVEPVENVRTIIKPFTNWAGQVRDPRTASRWFFSTPCASPWEMLAVASDGRVVPCCYDMDCRLTLGRVPDQSIEEIWHGRPLARLREKMRSGQFCDLPLCPDCDKARTYLIRPR